MHEMTTVTLFSFGPSCILLRTLPLNRARAQILSSNCSHMEQTRTYLTIPEKHPFRRRTTAIVPI